jgi:hypothetical protein
MTKYTLILFAFLGILLLSSCYTDDTAPPSPSRLPFEDFNEFFETNNAKADTLSFNADADALVTTPNGTKINIPENVFGTGGNISLEIKEATLKSDFIFLNKPTVDGNELLESSGAVFLKPFINSGQITIDNPILIEMMLPSGTTGDEMEYYYNQNGWTLDNTVGVLEDNNKISYETTRAVWQMGSKIYNDSGTAQLTIQPYGYGTIPHDMRAFVVFSDRHIVLPFDHNIADVSASGIFPKSEEVTILVMVMDHFKLSVGTKTLTLTENTDTEVKMEVVNVDEMRTIIKSLD